MRLWHPLPSLGQRRQAVRRAKPALGEGHLADMAFLDPPYNAAYEGGTAAKMTIANDALGKGFLDFLRPALINLLSVTKGASYVCMSSSEWPTPHRA